MENNQLKCSDYSIFFQCTQMTMNKMSTSSGLTRLPFGKRLQSSFKMV